MSLSDEEIRRLREMATLHEKVLEKLEALTKDINDLKAALAKKSFAQHPMFLLVLGFVLTGLVGSWLTSYWKDKEWSNQQAQLAQQRISQQKYAIIDKVTKAVAEAYVGMEDILHLADNGWYDKVEDEKAPPRAMNWLQSSRNWRVASETLKLDIAANIANPKAQSLFAQITKDWDLATNDILFIRAGLVSKKWAALESGDKIGEVDLLERSRQTRDTIGKMASRSNELVKIILEEIQDDATKSALTPSG